MQRLLPNWVFGAMVGFGVAVLAWTGLGSFGLDLPRFGSLPVDAFGIAFGAYAGSRGAPVRHLCGRMAAVIGAVGLILGFVGPLLLRPDSP